MTAPTVEVVHRCPDGDAVFTPCCGRTPLELPRTDRLTVQGALVTCTGRVRAPVDVCPPPRLTHEACRSLVEVLVPDFAAAVAAEQARRATTDGEVTS